jgi:hypothetical protein
MFITRDFAKDVLLRQRAFSDGIMAESVVDEDQRSRLFLTFHSGFPWLSLWFGHKLTRAVERLENLEIKNELYRSLGRSLIYKSEP